jgi:tetratricopeptide (TPR) repeat protein
MPEAMDQFRRAEEIDPRLPVAHYNMGNALASLEKLDEAVAEYRKALEIQPSYADAHQRLGLVWYEAGQFCQALPELAEAIRLQPDNASYLGQLAWALATCPEVSVRNGAKAIVLADEAVRFTDGKDVKLLDVLAAAYAESGRFAEAVATVRRALAMVSDRNGPVDADALRARLELYQRGAAYHQVRTDGQPHAGDF